MKILKKIFIVLGVIFAIILILLVIAISYILVTKPFDVDITKVPGALMGTSEVTESSYDHPALTTEQEIFLERVGVDTTQLSTSISAEQEKCAVEKLGQQRVDEIKSGSELGATDYFKARSCFE